MTKILIALVAVTVVLVGGGLLLRFIPPVRSLIAPQTVFKSQDDTLTSKVFNLEEEIATLHKKIESISTSSAQVSTKPSSTVDKKIADLESELSDLQTQVNQLKSSSTTTTTSTKRPPVYIPLGSNSNSSDVNWVTLPGFQITINPADYNGYAGMQLEVTSRLNAATTEGKARLLNITDNSVVGLSEISTKSSSFSLVSSGSFKLSSGTKTYVLQVQSVNGDIYFIQDARIKVSY